MCMQTHKRLQAHQPDDRVNHYLKNLTSKRTSCQLFWLKTLALKNKFHKRYVYKAPSSNANKARGQAGTRQNTRKDHAAWSRTTTSEGMSGSPGC